MGSHAQSNLSSGSCATSESVYRACTEALAASAQLARPLEDVCKILADQPAVQFAAIYVGVEPNRFLRCIAHAGLPDDCVLLSALASAQEPSSTLECIGGLQYCRIPRSSRPGSLALLPSPSRRASSCLLFSFRWSDRLVGALHVHMLEGAAMPEGFAEVVRNLPRCVLVVDDDGRNA